MWYGVKSIYYDGDNKFYEERITIASAQDKDEALDKAREESEDYSNNVGIAYCGYSEVFEIGTDKPSENSEIYSTMRYSELDAAQYIKKFVATGDELGTEREKI